MDIKEAQDRMTDPRSQQALGDQVNPPRTFLLGMGMAEAGTTWLFEYLAAHPQVRMGYEKEMHILHAPEYGSYLWSLANIPWNKFGGLRWLRTQSSRARYRADWSRYFDYFESLLGDDMRLTGDLSPSNQSMSVENLSRVRREFESRGIRVMPIFLMRYPVDRLLSQMKHRHRSSRNMFSKPGQGTVENLFLSKLFSVEAMKRMDARDTVARLSEVFQEHEMVVLLYEELFEQGVIDELARQSGIDPNEANLRQRVNFDPTGSVAPEALRAQGAVAFAATYRWAADRFGRSRILGSWQNAKYALHDGEGQ